MTQMQKAAQILQHFVMEVEIMAVKGEATVIAFEFSVFCDDIRSSTCSNLVLFKFKIIALRDQGSVVNVWGSVNQKKDLKPVLTMPCDEQKTAADHHEKIFSSNRDVNEWEPKGVCVIVSHYLNIPQARSPFVPPINSALLLSISRQGNKKTNKNQVFLLCSEDYWMDSFCGLKGLLGGSVHTKDQGAGDSFVSSRHRTLEKMNWKNFLVVQLAVHQFRF